MGVRGLGLLLLLALVGGAAGFGYAELTSEPAISDAPATPVSAADPAIPYTPPEVVKPDSELPSLPESFSAHDEKLGLPGEGGIVVPVPDGWVRSNLRDSEARWMPPGNPPGSYSVRVAVVDMRRTLSQAVAERAAALPGDPRISHVEILNQAGDTLRASFILDGYRKLTIIRWLSFDGDGIDVEIAATGRMIDETGMEALVARLATEVYRQQPHPPREGALADVQ